MFFLLTSILLLVIGLPAALFSAGYGQVYLDYGSLISSVVLILLLMLDLLKHRYSVLEYSQIARELLVLCTYSTLPTAEVLPTAKRLAHSYDPEVEIALASLLGGR